MEDVVSSRLAAPVAVSAPRLPIGIRADGEMTGTGLVFAFLLSMITVFLAFPLGILGIVLSNMGMNRVSTKPDTARRLVAWSWAIFVVTDTLALLVVVATLASH